MTRCLSGCAGDPMICIPIDGGEGAVGSIVVCRACGPISPTREFRATACQWGHARDESDLVDNGRVDREVAARPGPRSTGSCVGLLAHTRWSNHKTTTGGTTGGTTRGLVVMVWIRFQALAARVGVPIHVLLEMTAHEVRMKLAV
jgi:hypothetical protein